MLVGSPPLTLPATVVSKTFGSRPNLGAELGLFPFGVLLVVTVYDREDIFIA